MGFFYGKDKMPGLLQDPNQQPMQDQQAPVGNPEDQAMEGEPESQISESIEQHIREGVSKENQPALDKVIDAGMKLIFGKETHDKLFSQIRPEDQIPIEDELGTAATNMMLIMYQKSGNSIPGEVIVPAGTILLARATDFINESGAAQVTHEQFGEALNIFVDMIQAKLDPEYAKKMEGGQTEQPESAIQDGQAPNQPQQLLQGAN